MILALHPTDSAKPRSGLTLGVGHRIAQFLRWALVLLLVADIVGTPLHRHHHDSGIDGSAVHAQLAEPQHAAHHAEEDHHELDFVHAVTTVRAESRASAPDAFADGDILVVAPVSSWPSPGLIPAPIARLPWNDADTTLPPLHRSLPPAGRAPPLRA